MLSDKEIVEGISNNHSPALNFVYREFFPYTEAYILQQGGTREQAEDIFQDAMVVICDKINCGKFSLHCKFSTYLYAVCKRIWVQDRKKYYLRMNKLNTLELLAESESSYGRDSIDEAKELFEKHFKKLSPECQHILTMYFNGITIEEIREVRGITTVHHASDKKYRCKKNLIERIKADPNFRKMRNE